MPLAHKEDAILSKAWSRIWSKSISGWLSSSSEPVPSAIACTVMRQFAVYASYRIYPWSCAPGVARTVFLQGPHIGREMHEPHENYDKCRLVMFKVIRNIRFQVDRRLCLLRATRSVHACTGHALADMFGVNMGSLVPRHLHVMLYFPQCLVTSEPVCKACHSGWGGMCLMHTCRYDLPTI